MRGAVDTAEEDGRVTTDVRGGLVVGVAVPPAFNGVGDVEESMTGVIVCPTILADFPSEV